MPKLTPNEVLELEELIDHPCGAELYHKVGVFPRLVCTDGLVQVLARAEAFWLLDAIGSHLFDRNFKLAAAKDSRLDEMSFWTLTVDRHGEGIYLRCRADSDAPWAVVQCIDYTDFPLAKLHVWAVRKDFPSGPGWVLMLPNEY